MWCSFIGQVNVLCLEARPYSSTMSRLNFSAVIWLSRLLRYHLDGNSSKVRDEINLKNIDKMFIHESRWDFYFSESSHRFLIRRIMRVNIKIESSLETIPSNFISVHSWISLRNSIVSTNWRTIWGLSHHMYFWDSLVINFHDWAGARKPLRLCDVRGKIDNGIVVAELDQCQLHNTSLASPELAT